MSISAWPSILPCKPGSACALLHSSPLAETAGSNTTRIATIIVAPMNSAAANCHPIRTTMMLASSATRFVDVNSKTMAAAKCTLFRKMERATATAA